NDGKLGKYFQRRSRPRYEIKRNRRACLGLLLGLNGRLREDVRQKGFDVQLAHVFDANLLLRREYLVQMRRQFRVDLLHRQQELLNLSNVQKVVIRPLRTTTKK